MTGKSDFYELNMYKSVFLSLLLFFSLALSADFSKAESGLPDSVFVGGQLMHVQGLALDKEKECMYFSFTTRFIKTDLKGNILASIDRINGHLGAMTFNPEDRKVYASLECKNDEIGSDISRKLALNSVSGGESVFYIAIIDVDKLNEIGAAPENNDVLKTVCIREACEDYAASVSVDGTLLEHRFGCSGIDGVAIAPKPGKPEGKKYLYVAYGVYGDLNREDNNHQVLLRYDLKKINKHARAFEFGSLHKEGPASFEDKYFIYTGNTNYGVQNMAYDKYTSSLFLAVYKGKKKDFPNYNLFAVELSSKPFYSQPKGVSYSGKQKTLLLKDSGLKDEATGINGWRFKWGSTGLCPVGGGLWYISENAKNPQTKEQECTARLYRWTENKSRPFEPAYSRP